MSPETTTPDHPAGTQREHFLITAAPLDVATAYQLADCVANGAVVLMSGMVRNQTGGRPVAYLDYQAYEPMALALLQALARELRDRWPDLGPLVIHHRIGRLALGEISVLVAVGAPHRAEAFEACRYAIDTLKHQAPIWKKEYWADGGSDWGRSTGAASDLLQ